MHTQVDVTKTAATDLAADAVFVTDTQILYILSVVRGPLTLSRVSETVSNILFQNLVDAWDRKDRGVGCERIVRGRTDHGRHFGSNAVAQRLAVQND